MVRVMITFLAFFLLTQPAGLLDRDWRMAAAGGEAPVLRLSSGRASGTTGCNRFSGSFTLEDGGRLTIGAVAVTRRACDEPSMRREREFLGVLQRVNGYRLEDGELLLLENGWEIARFRIPESR